VLHCVAVYCSVLPCVAVCCIVLLPQFLFYLCDITQDISMEVCWVLQEVCCVLQLGVAGGVLCVAVAHVL